jgi:hypothetical protein
LASLGAQASCLPFAQFRAAKQACAPRRQVALDAETRNADEQRIKKKMDTDFVARHWHLAWWLHAFSSVFTSVPILIHWWIDNEAG